MKFIMKCKPPPPPPKPASVEVKGRSVAEYVHNLRQLSAEDFMNEYVMNINTKSDKFEDLPLSLIFAFHTVYPFQKQLIEPQRKAKEELMKIKHAKIETDEDKKYNAGTHKWVKRTEKSGGKGQTRKYRELVAIDMIGPDDVCE